ncbi:DUF6599 family protein [Planctomycetota bacterium]
MGNIQKQATHLESTISICLLAFLFLIAAGLFIKQFDTDMSRFGLGQVAAAKSETAFDLSSQAPVGFQTLSQTQNYNAENLYEKINGKAPLYTESGFWNLSTQRFINKTDQNLWMEVYLYDMANIKNAFSVFSVQRRAEADTASLFPLSFGYRTGNGLYFAHGQYYVEIVGSVESDELNKAVEEVARNMLSKLAVDGSHEIPELNLFPRDDIVAGSKKLYLRGAFGFEELTDTFAARYKIDGETITVFVSKRPDVKDAEELMAAYYDFLIENGAKDKEITSGFDNGKIVDFYGFTEIVFSNGEFVAGVHEAEEQGAALKAAVMLNDKLSEVTRK